jgi:hypothetical protein
MIREHFGSPEGSAGPERGIVTICLTDADLSCHDRVDEEW